MQETENKPEKQKPQTNKKKAFGWGVNPMVPFLPQNIAQAMIESQQAKQNSNSRIKKLDIYEIHLDKKLGSGYTSDVYLGVNTLTKQEVCIKVIDYLGLKTPGEKNMVESEIQCLKSVNNPYILKCYDILQSKQFCYIITEVCKNGDLYKRLQHKKSFTEPQILPIIKQLGSALLELKNKKIIHRDIKAQNILIKDQQIRLADFGFAIKQDQLIQNQSCNLGSPLYMSPETLFQNKYSYASDIFSFGITLYELIHQGRTPWETNNEQELKYKIINQEVQFKQGLSEELLVLLKGCLERNTQKRITIQSLMESNFLK